ncbi:MAG: PDZ domain-containing protein, partial [Atribacterota bacterium]
GDSDKARVGEWVIAIGDPYGLSYTVTVGVLSAKGRPINVGDSGKEYENFLQTDAAINPGNSGGPLLSIKGEVIGINTALLPFARGVGFAIPINMAKSLLDPLIEMGRVVRSWLGVYTQNLTPDMVQQFGIPGTKGALVADVIDNGPAAKAGVNRGDVITKVDETEIPDMKILQTTIRSKKPGEMVNLELWRSGQKKSITVVLEELKNETTTPNLVPRQEELGMEVQQITPGLVRQFALHETGGVVIVSIVPGGPADQSLLQPGDVILEFNRRKMNTINDWFHAVTSLKNGQSVLLLVDRGGETSFVPVQVPEKK